MNHRLQSQSLIVHPVQLLNIGAVQNWGEIIKREKFFYRMQKRIRDTNDRPILHENTYKM